MSVFDLGEFLREAGVNVDTSAEKQIEYIPMELIDPDPDNFYDLTNLEKLADSIATIGLQQPVIVRPAENGRYRIVSGHRRTAALRLLIEQDGWDDKVMCIVERQEEIPALTKLKLIMGNSETRVLTSAEQARQVEETRQAIYELKQAGYEFHGRVRDQVAEICKISAGKIARLDIIRTKLIPDFLKLWEAGALKDSVAYILAGQVYKRQKSVWSAQTDDGKKAFRCTADWLESIFRDMDRIENDCGELTCQENHTSVCDHKDVRLNRAAGLAQYQGMLCRTCCKDCYNLMTCKYSCPQADAAKQEKKDVEKAANQRAKDEQKERDRPKRDMLADVYSRVKELRSEKDISAPDFCKVSSGYAAKYEIDNLEELESGKIRLTKRLPGGIWPDEALRLIATADLLGCSIDYLLGRTDVKGIADSHPAEPEKCVKVDTWRTGTPPEPGKYVAMIRCVPDADPIPEKAEYIDGKWYCFGVEAEASGVIIDCWTEYPQIKKPTINDSCITGMSPSGHCGSAAYCQEPHTCCLQCDKDCNGRCGWPDAKEES